MKTLIFELYTFTEKTIQRKIVKRKTNIITLFGNIWLLSNVQNECFVIVQLTIILRIFKYYLRYQLNLLKILYWYFWENCIEINLLLFEMEFDKRKILWKVRICSNSINLNSIVFAHIFRLAKLLMDQLITKTMLGNEHFQHVKHSRAFYSKEIGIYAFNGDSNALFRLILFIDLEEIAVLHLYIIQIKENKWSNPISVNYSHYKIKCSMWKPHFI